MFNIAIAHVQVIDYSTRRIPSMSGKNPDGYLVKQIKESWSECSSTTEASATMCTQSECKQLCYHMYTCGKYCFNYTNRNLCKHIHRAHSMWLKLRDPNNHCYFDLFYPNGSGAGSDSDFDDPLEFAERVWNPSMHNYDCMQLCFNFDYYRPGISTNDL